MKDDELLLKPARTLVTFHTTTAGYLRDCLRVMVDHLVELLDYFHLLLYLPLELVQALQDLLYINVHLIELLAMTISTDPDLIDLIVVGLEDSTNLLGNRRQVALQLVPLWY